MDKNKLITIKIAKNVELIEFNKWILGRSKRTAINFKSLGNGAFSL